MQIKDYLASKQIGVATTRHKYLWQEIAEEVSKYFGKPCYWLFHKYQEDWIITEYKWQKEHSMVDYGKLIRYLQWKKKMESNNK